MREHERGSSTTVREGASYAVFTPSLTVGLPPRLSANPFTQHYNKKTPPAFANGVFCEMNYPVATAAGTDST